MTVLLDRKNGVRESAIFGRLSFICTKRKGYKKAYSSFSNKNIPYRKLCQRFEFDGIRNVQKEKLLFFERTLY